MKTNEQESGVSSPDKKVEDSKQNKVKASNPDKEHFDKQLLKELAWKLDREVWAHVPNPEPGEPWTQSKAREVTRELISEYIGNYDVLKHENDCLKETIKHYEQFVPGHERDGFQEPTVNNEVI